MNHDFLNLMEIFRQAICHRVGDGESARSVGVVPWVGVAKLVRDTKPAHRVAMNGNKASLSSNRQTIDGGAGGNHAPTQADVSEEFVEVDFAVRPIRWEVATLQGLLGPEVSEETCRALFGRTAPDNGALAKFSHADIAEIAMRAGLLTANNVYDSMTELLEIGHGDNPIQSERTPLGLSVDARGLADFIRNAAEAGVPIDGHDPHMDALAGVDLPKPPGGHPTSPKATCSVQIVDLQCKAVETATRVPFSQTDVEDWFPAWNVQTRLALRVTRDDAVSLVTKVVAETPLLGKRTKAAIPARPLAGSETE